MVAFFDLASGYIVANSTKFPYGMRNWTDSINALNISGAAYSSNGYLTCGGVPGGYGNELKDLEVFREWGWNYLKYDNCFIVSVAFGLRR